MSIVSLQYSIVCFCGNEYDTYGSAKESQCNMKCDGNKNEVCGGDWVNSIYSGINIVHIFSDSLYKLITKLL